MKNVPVASRYSVRAVIAILLREGNVTVRRAAQQLGISPRSLQRQLTETGASFSELVAEVRLETACHLLTESELSIAEIACRLGYSGPSSFSRIFMRLMKIQPAVYRRQRVAGMNGKRSNAGRRRGTGAAVAQ